MKRLLAKAVSWLRDLIQDPDGSPSSSRVCGVACYMVAFYVAIANTHLGHEQSATVVGLCAGGAAALAVRRRSEGTAGGDA